MMSSLLPSVIAAPLSRLSRILALGLLLMGLTACATAGADPDANDPWESVNRPIFNANMALDRHLLKPVAKGYRSALPGWTRTGIRNFIDNLQAPVILVNDLLQGDFKRADETLQRFALNTLTGPAGLRDVARTERGIEGHGEDFGQTLGVWGIGPGPYLVVPFLGPSSPRDLIGRGADSVIDPFFYVNWGDKVWLPAARGGLDIIDARSRTLDPLDEVERTSIDFYATVRSLYQQSRASAVRNGEIDVENLPDF